MDKQGYKIDMNKIKPTRLYYGLAILIFIIGVLLFVLIIIKSLIGITKGFTRVVVPGKSEILFPKPGKYTIFHEYKSVINNKVYSTGQNLPGLQCTLTDKATGSPISLSPVSISSSYSLGSREGRAIWEFTIDKAGTYELFCWYSETQEGPEVVLAIGTDFTKKLLGKIFLAIAILFGSISSAILITIIIFFKRQKSKKRLEKYYT